MIIFNLAVKTKIILRHWFKSYEHPLQEKKKKYMIVIEFCMWLQRFNEFLKSIRNEEFWLCEIPDYNIIINKEKGVRYSGSYL